MLSLNRIWRTALDFRLLGNRRIGDYYKVQKLVSAVIRGRRIFASALMDGQYVDVGCGPNIQLDWYNVDWLWRPGVDLCWDVTDGLPFPDDSVSGFYSEHCMEHIELQAFVLVLKDMYRTLKRGGWVRIVVPDAALYCRLYVDSLAGKIVEIPYQNEDIAEIGNEIYSPVYSVNRIMRHHGHRFIYDYNMLEKVFRNAGFSMVESKEFGETNDPKLRKDSATRRIESLYLEARK